jgi:hypothetical protein
LLQPLLNLKRSCSGNVVSTSAGLLGFDERSAGALGIGACSRDADSLIVLGGAFPCTTLSSSPSALIFAQCTHIFNAILASFLSASAEAQSSSSRTGSDASRRAATFRFVFLQGPAGDPFEIPSNASCTSP